MDIRNFFQKIFVSTKEIQLPPPVKQKFEAQFSDSINTEWQKSGEQYEAVFYTDELEHIASYYPDGTMSCLKVNLPLTDLPETIESTAGKEGELMNAIRIECDGKITFELIVRDTDLIRYFLLLNESGDLLKKEKL